MATTGNRGVQQADERNVDRPAIANLDNVVQFFRVLLEWDTNRRDSSISSPAQELRPNGSAAGVITPSSAEDRVTSWKRSPA